MTTQSELIETANAEPTPTPNRVTVLYGDYGKRKTMTACSMVNKRGLLMSSDASWKVLLNERHREVREKIKTVELDGLSQLDLIDFTDFDTIIWDTVSRSVADYISILLHHAKWNGNMRERLTTSHKELKNLENVGISDYRVTRDAFEPVFRKLFALPANLIFTAQLTEPIPNLSKNTKDRPMIPAATFQPLGERADIIANIRPESRGFVADMTESSVTMLGKSRIEGLQGKMNLDAFVSTYKEIVF